MPTPRSTAPMHRFRRGPSWMPAGRPDRNRPWWAASSCPWQSASWAAPRVHPLAQFARQLMGVASAVDLAGIIAAVGLAQNLAAIRALATEGIQKGHMALHARQIATAAGARTDEVDTVSAVLVAERQIRVDRAREVLAQLRSHQV